MIKGKSLSHSAPQSPQLMFSNQELQLAHPRMQKTVRDTYLTETSAGHWKADERVVSSIEAQQHEAV